MFAAKGFRRRLWAEVGHHAHASVAGQRIANKPRRDRAGCGPASARFLGSEALLVDPAVGVTSWLPDAIRTTEPLQGL